MLHLKLFIKMLSLSFLKDIEYRANLYAMLFSGLIWVFIPLVLFKAIYLNIDTIAGWTWHDMLLLIGSYTIIDSLMMFLLINNMNQLQSDIMDGKLDQLLTKPIDSQFYVSFKNVNYSQLFNVFPGILMIVYVFYTTPLEINITTLLIYLIYLILGMLIYYSVWFIWTALSFWLPNIRSRERLFLDAILMARFPLPIYKGLFGILFTYIIPLAVIANPAALVLMGKLTWVEGIVVLILALVMVSISRIVWQKGLNSYSSAGG
ncbi:ABC transporter permease [Paenibacillus xylanexedens]|uniref:ABC transporter permease n=1 Tax=Paenibacillus xylanexedens TaxID=528191 RepID=UPI003CFC3F43